MEIHEFLEKRVNTIIKNKIKNDNNLIFVFLGVSTIIKESLDSEFFADYKTFGFEQNDKTFDKVWFTKVFTTLNIEKEYHLLSFSQFSYLINYIDYSFFKDRIVIIKDNLRQLFPINENEFLEKVEDENIEKRPDDLPVHHAEQLQIKNKYYYSVKTPIDAFATENIFKSKTKLKKSKHDVNFEVIDVSSDRYAIDTFINDCIYSNNFSKNAIVKYYSKQPLSQDILSNLEKLNYLLNQFGRELFILDETAIADDYKVKKSTKELLFKYWGENADFRNINVYKNPNIDKEIIDISQGLIVETIIEEYENSRNHKPTRDLFLTAPTGAGKSLLFQLPAFYVSQKGDVTIVVSPLIALMKDQVLALINDRKFDKVAFLNSELSLIDREKIIENCKDGNVDILYLSPELLLSYEISHFIGDRELGLLVIDEAHLITTWGRDFRVDYWFLGNHIRKIRKYRNLTFPMVAVTATAIYGGVNDMVFDSIDSLVMQNPHIFIGQVKRNDIKFIVNNYDGFEANYERNKLNQTVEFVKQVNELELKTLVYTPYTKHIRQILDELRKDNLNIASGYYGALDSTQKEFAYRNFKTGEHKIMVSTKAFGMGVDISDIQVVYHHAPSGLLPDYVQEIGRVARKPSIQGFAILNYSSQDQRFSKALHGMSALRQYQLHEVLKKLFKSYQKNNSRNLLLSVDDFGHIFQNAIDLDQKVLTALMMIEKDYLAKSRFNVLIARPKKLFVRVYAKVSNNEYVSLEKSFSFSIKLISDTNNGFKIIEIDLDKVWYKHFSHKSFPTLKRDFYLGNLFKDFGIEIQPQLKISFERLDNFSIVYHKLQDLLSIVQKAFVSLDGYFSQQEFQGVLNKSLNDKVKSEKISKFVLSTYSGRLIRPGVIEDNAFLQQRRGKTNLEYRVFNNRYLANFASLLKRLNNLFSDTDNTIVNRFITNKESNAITYVRLGYFLEMLEIGTFEIKGGENPMVFVRINDPQRIERDSKSKSYRNALLSKTLERHTLSNQIFDHFFLRSFTNSERWNFIEDFFLGSDVDILLNDYKGEESNNTDIIKYLGENSRKLESEEIDYNSKETSIHIFQPNSETFYKMSNLLTINTDDGLKTMKVTEWLTKDPISFDKARRETEFKIDCEVFKILSSRLKNHYPDYFRDSLGLNVRINFKGYDKPIKAIAIYKDHPVEFYKWWQENKDIVTLTFKEKLELLNKVNVINPNVLKRKDYNLIHQ